MTDALDELEQRVTEKYLAACKARAPQWELPDWKFPNTDTDGDTVAVSPDYHDDYGPCVELALVEADSGDYRTATLSRAEFARLVAWGSNYLATECVPAASGSAGTAALDAAGGEPVASSAAPTR